MCGVSNLVIETPNSFELPSNDEFLFYIKKPDPEVKIGVGSAVSAEIDINSSGSSRQRSTQQDQPSGIGNGARNVNEHANTKGSLVIHCFFQYFL